MCCDIPHLGGFVRILNATGSGNPVSLPPPQPMTTITLHLCTALENNHQLLHIYHHFQPFRQARKACRRFRQYGLHVSSTLAFFVRLYVYQLRWSFYNFARESLFGESRGRSGPSDAHRRFGCTPLATLLLSRYTSCLSIICSPLRSFAA
jgi:hypothetical protein